MKSDSVEVVPVLDLPEIHIEILPCYVFDVIVGNEELLEQMTDFELPLGVKLEYVFERFT